MKHAVFVEPGKVEWRETADAVLLSDGAIWMLLMSKASCRCLPVRPLGMKLLARL